MSGGRRWCGQRRRSERHGNLGGERRGDLIGCSGLKQCGRRGLESDGSLHARFSASGHENPFDPALAELRRFRFKRVFTSIERGKAEGAVLRGGRQHRSARSLIAQHHLNVRQRS